MATPVGHALAGLAIGALGAQRDVTPRRLSLGRWLLLGALFAVAPDLDFVPGILAGAPAWLHQGPTHSIAFGLLAAGAAAWGLRRRCGEPWLRATGLLGLAWASHLGMDWLGPDARAPYGIPLLWPFSDATFLVPTAWLPGVVHVTDTQAGVAAWLTAIATPANAVAVVVEALFVAPLLLLAGLRWRRSVTP